MAAADVIDATAVEERGSERRTDVLPAAPAPPPVPALAVTPQVQATELVERLDVIRQAMTNAMQEGIDYGRIPGVNKPTLLKPGAEKLGVLFQLDIQITNTKTWGPGEHLTVESHATVYHAPTGARLGYGEGLCTTREKKYGKRKAERICPQCGQPAVIKGKAEFGGGWLCWARKGGCNAKWADGDQAIEGQQNGDVDNPELPDTWNTVVKMAAKRARIDAVLATTGASALFTQDVEDDPDAGQAAAQAPAQRTSAAAPTAREPQQTRPAATPAQRKLIFNKARAKGMSDDAIRDLLQHVAGTVHSDRIARDDVDAVLAAIEEA